MIVGAWCMQDDDDDSVPDIDDLEIGDDEIDEVPARDSDVPSHRSSNFRRRGDIRKNSKSISPSVMLIKVPCGNEIVTANLSLNYLQKSS